MPDCPNLAPVRTVLYAALAELGLPAEVVEVVVGDYPSPSVLINGVDVMGETAGEASAACRLDLPTVEHILGALRRATTCHTPTAAGGAVAATAEGGAQPGRTALKSQRFSTAVGMATRGRILIPVPFDPDAVWGPKPRHHIGGTVNHMRVRGVVEPAGDGFGFTLGPAWLRGCGLAVGDTVTVDIAPEGPQRGDLADDVAAELAAHPRAAAFFDSLAQFYRRGYLRWIDATKRRPDQRSRRIAEMIQLLEAGQKQRPQ